MQVGEVVSAVRARHGADVTVLRLLDARPDPADDFGMGGEVVYLAEVDSAVASALDASGLITPDPAARPALAWADGVLAERGSARVGPAEQERTWNLSAIWRLPLADGAAWLKVVPPFFAHEGGVLRLLQDSGVVPPLLGTDGGRMLLGDVPGVDQYRAPTEFLGPMVDMLVDLQVAWIGRVDSLSTAGANDWRPPTFIGAAIDVVRRDGAALSEVERTSLGRLVDGLEGRFAALAECGLPDTLVPRRLPSRQRALRRPVAGVAGLGRQRRWSPAVRHARLSRAGSGPTSRRSSTGGPAAGPTPFLDRTRGGRPP